jgi:DNA polymerase I-like protein with 3'-5' exonuclease and polymerase domains
MLVATHEIDTDTGSEQVYNGMDCCLTHEIFGELSKQLSAAEPAYSFELAMQAPVIEMMLRGLRVDPGARELGIGKCREDIKRLHHILKHLTEAVLGTPYNEKLPNSSVQLKTLFYEHLGIEPIKAWVKGELKFPMDNKIIAQVENYFQARPIAASVLKLREIEKQLQVLLTEVDDDWRMRTSYNIGGTKSARFSSSKSVLGTGTNQQNITEELRHIFVADPGMVMCGMDAEQSDSRMIGYMCGVLFNDWTYLNACESSDLHTSVCRLVWTNELPWTGDMAKDRKIAERPFYRHHKYRDAVKRLGHGANFLGKPPTLSKETGVPIKLVEGFVEKYFTAFPAIQRWQSWTAAQLQQHKYLISIHGRRRDFFDRTDAAETVRKGLAFLAAAPTADNLNLGMWRIWKYMPEVQLLAQVHDAVYFQFPETCDRNDIIRRAKACLTTELHAPNGRKFTVPTDCKIGYNWGTYIPADKERGTPEQNPKGLRKFKLAA